MIYNLKPIIRKMMSYLHYFLIPLRYKLNIIGLDKIEWEKLNPNSGILFLSNHTSNVDASIIGTILIHKGIPIIIWAINFVFELPYLKICTQYVEGISVVKVPDVGHSRSAKNRVIVNHLILRTLDGLKRGKNFLIFPSAHSKSTSLEQIDGKSGVHKIVQQFPESNIVFIRITGLWGSRFSWASKRFPYWNTEKKRWNSLLWDIFKMFIFNFFIFIPRRDVTVEFQLAPLDFPRNGSRLEFDQYLENFYNAGWGPGGEPLTRVSDYFWKRKYCENQFNLTDYLFNIDNVSQEIKDSIIKIIAEVAKIDVNDIHPQMNLARSLGLDSLEITDILMVVEKKFGIQKLNPSQISTVGHLIALSAKVHVISETRKGEFRHIIEKPPAIEIINQWVVRFLKKKN